MSSLLFPTSTYTYHLLDFKSSTYVLFSNLTILGQALSSFSDQDNLEAIRERVSNRLASDNREELISDSVPASPVATEEKTSEKSSRASTNRLA